MTQASFVRFMINLLVMPGSIVIVESIEIHGSLDPNCDEHGGPLRIALYIPFGSVPVARMPWVLPKDHSWSTAKRSWGWQCDCAHAGTAGCVRRHRPSADLAIGLLTAIVDSRNGDTQSVCLAMWLLDHALKTRDALSDRIWCQTMLQVSEYFFSHKLECICWM